MNRFKHSMSDAWSTVRLAFGRLRYRNRLKPVRLR
jgi:hypothetical protein